MTVNSEQDLNEAINNAESALYKIEEEYRIKTVEYVVALFNLAVLYCSNYGYDKAELLYKKALVVLEEISGKNNSYYAACLNNLALLYNSTGRNDEAEDLYIESLKIRAKVSGMGDLEYLKSQINLAWLYYTTGHHKESENLYRIAKEVLINVAGERDPNYIQLLINFGQLYHTMGRHTEAESLYKKSLEIREKNLETNKPDYPSSLSKLAELYSSMNRYSEAESLYKKALESQKVIDEYSTNYVLLLNNIGELYNTTGRQTEAESLFNMGIGILKNIYKERDPAYAHSLNMLAKLYQSQNRYDKAEPLYKIALEIRREIFREWSAEYAESVNNLGALYTEMKRFADAEPLFTQSIEIRKKAFGKNPSDYAQSLNNLAALYYSTGRYDEAEPLYEAALEIQKQALGERHLLYAQTLNNLAALYMLTDRINKAEPLIVNAIEIYFQQLTYNYPSLSEKEKYQFLQTIDYSFEVFYSFVLDYNEKSIELIKKFQNLIYATKGNILNATAQVKNNILNRGSKDLIELYDEFIAKRKELSVAYTLSKEDLGKRGLEIAKLENGTNELEKELSFKSESFKSEVETRNIKWEDVRAKLNTDEAIIDYISFQHYNKKWSDVTFYCALVTRTGYEAPGLIKLCTHKELENLLKVSLQSDESYITNEKVSFELYKLIWQPLEQYLSGAKTIYVSPSGLLHRISFAALRTCAKEQSDKLLIDKYHIRYMGNMKDLVTRKEELPISNRTGQIAAIFGGADYDLPLMPVNKDDPHTLVVSKLPDSVTNQFGGIKWTNLRLTKKEAEKLSELFKSRNIKVLSYVGENATEEALISLNNKNSPTILHIATHGFFFPQSEKTSDKQNVLPSETNSIFKQGENPLLRSGIVLSGANYVWTENKQIENTEDGVVTAYEISNMDLINTELVVLSACETGLGDIKGSEGVFGLQRAFKTAGADAVIMTLWTIKGKMTGDLMDLFYTKWLSGKTKYESLYEAQKEMREKKVPVYYWAAFVCVE